MQSFDLNYRQNVCKMLKVGCLNTAGRAVSCASQGLISMAAERLVVSHTG